MFDLIKLENLRNNFYNIIKNQYSLEYSINYTFNKKTHSIFINFTKKNSIDDVNAVINYLKRIEKKLQTGKNINFLYIQNYVNLLTGTKHYQSGIKF